MHSRFMRLDALLEAAGKALREQRPALIAAALAADACPLPTWVKAIDGTMIWLNREYQSRYGITIEQYQNLGEAGVWGMLLADKFRSNDESVINTRRPWRGLEEIAGGIEVQVLKWPTFDESDTRIIGVCGMVLE